LSDPAGHPRDLAGEVEERILDAAREGVSQARL
jgi:hypothetical protein